MFEFFGLFDIAPLEYYEANVYCTNCRVRLIASIRKGHTVEEAIKGVACPRCKCKKLHKENE